MDGYLDLPPAERRLLCEEASVGLGLAPPGIEKDFWVCWILRELFRLPEWGRTLTFKGGTSLSKGWRLIERFSEDIDIVIDRNFLGFPGENLSAGQIAKLREASRKGIASGLMPKLQGVLSTRLEAERGWALTQANEVDAPDLQTMLFQYPAVSSAAGYVRPVVRIELGARSEVEPAEAPTIRPMLAETHASILGDSPFAVRTVAPRRTFWEKAMLLHEESFRPPGRPRAQRLSRHYYDLWCLITRGVAAEAVADVGLFERVAAHRQRFFRYRWMDYATLSKGRLRIVPAAEHEAEWRRDYEAMRTEMFFGEPPSFEVVLGAVSAFEREFNAS